MSTVTTQPLIPQTFDSDAVTLLPEIDFFATALAQLPQVYQNAPNFVAMLQVIATQKQYYYDVMRSLVNVYNLNSSDGYTKATPTGVYLQMLASNITAPFNPGTDSDPAILNSINSRINFVNSRGRIKDFWNYMSLAGYGAYFTNQYVYIEGNATLFISAPIPPGGTPDPLTQFSFDIFKLKGAGIEVNVTPTDVPPFCWGGLDSYGNPTIQRPGAGNWGTIEPRGNIVGGGYWGTTIPPP